MASSILATTVLAPVALLSLFFGDAFFYLAAAFCAAAFIRLVFTLLWSWQKGEIWEWGARICSLESSPVVYWVVMLAGLIAAIIFLFGMSMSISEL